MAMEWKLHVELSGIKKKAIRRLCKAFNRRSPDRQKGDDEFNFDALSCHVLNVWTLEVLGSHCSSDISCLF